VTAKIFKIVAWTLGMTVGVHLITDGKTISEHPFKHALIGASIGLVLGFLFARNLKRSNSNTAN
jgi:hypothetical protein